MVDAQVGETEASRLYASGAGHIGSSSIAPELGQGSRATVQILRSIDGRSAQLHRGVPFPALHYKKGRPVDHSILTACAPPSAVVPPSPSGPPPTPAATAQTAVAAACVCGCATVTLLAIWPFVCVCALISLDRGTAAHVTAAAQAPAAPLVF